MNPVYISIGSQCTTPTVFDRLNIKNMSLPFDWMFSTPEFVYTILKLLLIDKLDINEIVDNHFFYCDKRATLSRVEHHTINTDGQVLVNSKYNVCFPHDTLSDRDKYIRRIERLKEIILDKGNFIYFVYVSVSSSSSGNYTLDGVEPIQNIYEYTEKINSIIEQIRNNYKIILFDTTMPLNTRQSDNSNIIYNVIPQKNSWGELIPEILNVWKYINI